MTKVKAVKPSPTLLAARRAKEKVPPIPKDYAMHDKRLLIDSVRIYPGVRFAFRYFIFHLLNTVTGRVSSDEKVAL